MAQPAPVSVAEQPKPMEDEAKATITYLLKRIAELESQLSRYGTSAQTQSGFGAFWAVPSDGKGAGSGESESWDVCRDCHTTRQLSVDCECPRFGTNALSFLEQRLNALIHEIKLMKK